MKIKVRHLIIAFCLLVLIARYEEVFRIYWLMFYWITSLFSGSYQQLTGEVIDYFISAGVLIFLPVYILFSKNRFLNLVINPSSALLLILFLAALTAPVFTSFDPEFQKNISVTRLLPPFSEKYMVSPPENTAADYSSLRKEVVKENFYEQVIITDRIPSEEKEFRVETAFYLLGTDELGRDLFSRLIYGTRISLMVGLLSVIISLITGLLLGFFAGYYEGWGGSAFNKVTDIFLSFPSLFLVILILALFGNSILSVIIVLGFTGWMSLFKIIRSEVKSLRSRDYFITAYSLGLNKKILIFKEMLPVVIVPVINNLILLFGSVIVAEASLSYIGLGTGMMHPSWGSMIDQGQNYMRTAWWMILMPGLFLFITLFSANNIGKRIQSYFNPRLK